VNDKEKTEVVRKKLGTQKKKETIIYKGLERGGLCTLSADGREGKSCVHAGVGREKREGRENGGNIKC